MAIVDDNNIGGILPEVAGRYNRKFRSEFGDQAFAETHVRLPDGSWASQVTPPRSAPIWDDDTLETVNSGFTLAPTPGATLWIDVPLNAHGVMLWFQADADDSLVRGRACFARQATNLAPDNGLGTSSNMGLVPPAIVVFDVPDLTPADGQTQIRLHVTVFDAAHTAYGCWLLTG